MERPDGIPVGQAAEAARVEHGRLVDRYHAPVGGALIPADHLELQPAAAGETHLGHEPDPARWIARLHPPAVEDIPGDEAVGIATPAPHSRAPQNPVDPAAQLPEPLVPVPAVRAADPLDGGKSPLGRDIDGGMAMIDEPWPLEVAAIPAWQFLGIGDVGPPPPLENGVLPGHRVVHRHRQRPRPDWKIVEGGPIGDDGRVFQPVDQLPTDLRIPRCDQRQPEARQPGG